MKKQTFLDVTQLVEWGGKLTGIPRVMNEYSIRFVNEPEVSFTCWDRKKKTYFEVDIRKVLQKFEDTTSDEAPASDKPLASRIKTQLRAVKKISKKVPVVKYPLRAVYRTIQAEKRARQNKTYYKENTNMKNGDQLVVFWGTWDDKSFIEDLKRKHQNGITLCQIVYDMLPIVTPQYSGHSSDHLLEYGKAIYPICDLIICISEHTKVDLVDWLKSSQLQVPKLEVIRLGDDFNYKKPVRPKTLSEVENFLLCVGTIEARKNHALIYYAYKLAAQRKIELPPVVIVGQKGWRAVEIYELMTTDPDVKEKFIFIHNATDGELAYLYQKCLFTIYPSFYEGWGLPVAESILRGAPCISSNTSSLTEIAGDLIDYFSPASTDECLDSIVTMLDDDYRAQAKKRLHNYKPYSWDSSFKVLRSYIEKQ